MIIPHLGPQRSQAFSSCAISAEHAKRDVSSNGDDGQNRTAHTFFEASNGSGLTLLEICRSKLEIREEVSILQHIQKVQIAYRVRLVQNTTLVLGSNRSEERSDIWSQIPIQGYLGVR